MKPEDPIRVIPKIGPKYEKLLNYLGIYKIEDLLYHFPFRYEDYTKVKNIADLEADETATIKAELVKIDNIVTRNKKKLTKAIFKDETGKLEVIWFNMFYIKDSVKEGEWYYLSGKVNKFNKKLSFLVPTVESASGDNVNTARLVPVYSETAGLSSKWLRTRINQVFKTQINLLEFLPNTTLNKHNLENINEAIKNFHFPSSWEEVSKARKRFAFEELLLELLNVEQRKKEWVDNAVGIQLEEQDISILENSLPFTLTESQADSIKEIIGDLIHHKPMNRLLEGDVGTGKTVVAVLAAYFNYLNGYKTLYMAPTEILAKQHYQTFRDFLDNLGIKTEIATGATKGDLDNFGILVGTHAILHATDKLDNIGLIIIDEQHRFGVEQRAKLTEINSNRKTPNILTMTATPIPRTMALTLYGDLKISQLKTAPNKDKKITTRVIPIKQREKTYKWIEAQNEPTFIVCPFIEESENEAFENVKAATKVYEELSKGIFKNKKVGLLHGKMRNAEKEEIVDKFRTGKLDILVSTPVIEVGIDIPDAVIMVIESAERYGLASLHQLRGRVGRGQKEGYCLVMPSTYSKQSQERLQHLETVNSGLELAEIDMKLRGHGDIYGTLQSGFKKFKVASLHDVELLEAAKLEAEEIYPKLTDYPNLLKKFKENNPNLIAFN